jgi:hypothetical protein
MNAETQKLITDGANFAANKNNPCAICGKRCSDADTYPIVINASVVCGRCYMNARAYVETHFPI